MYVFQYAKYSSIFFTHLSSIQSKETRLDYLLINLLDYLLIRLKDDDLWCVINILKSG